VANTFVGLHAGVNSTLSDPPTVFKGPTAKEREEGKKEWWLGGKG